MQPFDTVHNKQPADRSPNPRPAPEAAAGSQSPVIRPLFAVSLIVLGWIVVVGLTAFGLSRYRGSTTSAPPSAQPVNESAMYLRDIHQRLATW